MIEQMVVYGLLIITFILVSMYNFKIRYECIYPVRLTKPRIIISIIIPFIFCFIAYIGGNLWHYYILALVAAICIISSIVGEGIHEKGIYYYPGKRLIATLAKWEDIKDIKVDMSKNQLKSFKNTKTNIRIYTDQYYSLEGIVAIKKFIEG
ncbi:hypothetical protein DES36_13011 [Alkalibaculum bacchi]|uniref:Uncharacterized protein n=1 Tax=Alkalibaculum bacchi TaxID=645887 RepID=A0A366HXT2_9FIRM|nr:hypothetical protein [Alkalibaculum bacchi]RBP57398.1 hypothetical protein DES36_13011 [Alkalibaculum bacchi]